MQSFADEIADLPAGRQGFAKADNVQYIYAELSEKFIYSSV
jgi:hypothetical protein